MSSWIRQNDWCGATEGDWRSAVSRGLLRRLPLLPRVAAAHGVNVGQGGHEPFQPLQRLSKLWLCLGTPTLPPEIDDLLRQRDARPITTSTGALPQAQGLYVGAGSGHTLIADFQALLKSVPARANRRRGEAIPQSIGHIP